ncbi:MAG: insulinase family protein [Rhodospirillales bacterium]|nr:insulinase family protein [Rhodospirillales bacterium]MCB9996870.1 insulinase family protein [Rhodospirillales bacterium]
MTRHVYALPLILTALFLLTISQAWAGEGKVLDIKEVKSDAGLTAWLVEDHTLPVIAFKFAFKGAGSSNDPADKQGLTQLLSNTLDEGAGEYDSQRFQKTLNDNNISLSFSKGRDDFYGSVYTLSKHKDTAFTLLKLALTAPRFDEDAVERMRAANLARVRSDLSNPNWKAARIMNDVAFEGHPYALNSGGTISGLNAVTPDDLRQAAKTLLARDNLYVSVVGDIDAQHLKALLDDVFGGLPEKAAVATVPDLVVQNGGQTVLYKEDIPQTIINMMQPGIGREHPDYYKAMVMNFILGGSGFGSRLTEEIREKRGLTYGISTYFYDLAHLKGYAVGTSTKNDSVAELIALTQKEWTRMRDEPVTAEELKNAKSYLIGSLPLSLSSTSQIAGLMSSLQVDGMPIDYLDVRADKIEAVTIEDVQKLAQSLLTPDQMTVIMVGNPEGVTPTKVVDTLPNVE